jgi:hypothetical protein
MSDAAITDAPADHRARVAEFLDRFGRERNLTLPALDAEGVGQVQRGSAVVQIHVLADKGVLLLLAKVAAAPIGDAEVLRELLVASFTSTGDAAFAIHPRTGDCYLRIMRSLDGLDYEEFEDLTHTIAMAADEWDGKLAKRLGRG